MEYQPHQQRVVDEKVELDERLSKLEAFILDNPIYKGLDEENRALMEKQREVMSKYSNILDKRISLFA